MIKLSQIDSWVMPSEGIDFMKRSQIIILILLLIIATVIIWVPAGKEIFKKNQSGDPTSTPVGTSDVNLTTPTLPPDPTDPPEPTPEPTPYDPKLPDLNASDFSGYSTTAVEWEAGFGKNADGTTSAWYNTALDKYIKGFDYIFTKNDSDTKKEIYLTFNISYDEESTVKILDVLKEHNSKNQNKVYVTFFVQSDCLDWTDVMKRIVNEGHQIAIRSFPGSMSEKSVKDIESALKAIEAKYRKIFGSDVRMFYYRPGDTFSAREIAVANALGYKVVFYCFKYRDWDTVQYNATGTDGKINAALAVEDNFHDGSVIQLLASELNAEILPKLISEGISQGFTFERLDQ